MTARTAASALVLTFLAYGGAAGLAPRVASAHAADTPALRTALDATANGHRGIAGCAVGDLDTGAAISRRGDETFPADPLIKLPILVTEFDLVARGMLSLDDPLTLLAIDRAPGSGTLRFLHDGLPITVRDAEAFLGPSVVAMDSCAKCGPGVTTQNEATVIVARLASGEAVSPAHDSTMPDFLVHNEDEAIARVWAPLPRSP